MFTSFSFLIYYPFQLLPFRKESESKLYGYVRVLIQKIVIILRVFINEDMRFDNIVVYILNNSLA